MWKWILGPVLVGGGYATGSVYGRDAEQLVHQNPAVTYAAFDQAISNVPESGTTFFDGGSPMPYEIGVDRELDHRLTVSILFAGREGARAELDFAPADDGKDTLIVTHVHGDSAVLRTALAGTSRARLAYAPDWMLNLAAGPTLRQLGAQIDAKGEAAFGETAPADAATHWQNDLTDDQRNDIQDWQQYDATRPSLDPDAAANASSE